MFFQALGDIAPFFSIFYLVKLNFDIFWVLIPKIILIFAENQYSDQSILCTKLAKMPKYRHFCVVVAPTILGVCLGYIWVSLAKWPPKHPLMMLLTSDEIWGLVLVHTGLARILKFDKIKIQQILRFQLNFKRC